MYNKFDFEKVRNELNNKSYIFEGDNHVAILKTENNLYSLQKEDLDSLKLLFEIEDLKYEVIPFKYNKYKKQLEKYARNNEIWLFQILTVGPDWTYSPFNFKNNKVEWLHWSPETLEAAKKFNFTIHLNEKPNCWTQYSNNL